MKFYSFQIIIEKEPEDEGYFAYSPTVPGCFSNGKTIEDTKRNIRQAIEQDRARASQAETPQVLFVGSQIRQARGKSSYADHSFDRRDAITSGEYVNSLAHDARWAPARMAHQSF
jgi:hypothetical protein